MQRRAPSGAALPAWPPSAALTVPGAADYKRLTCRPGGVRLSLPRGPERCRKAQPNVPQIQQ
jgi:hypothetical protein